MMRGLISVVNILFFLTSSILCDYEKLKHSVEEIENKLEENSNLLTYNEFLYEITNEEDHLNTEDVVTTAAKKVLSSLLEDLDLGNIKDEEFKRKLMRLPKVKYESLPVEEFDEINEILQDMNSIYATVNLCSYQDKSYCNFTLIPDVQDALDQSQDINEIRYYWLEWRHQTKRQIMKQFQRFIKLYRKAARLSRYEKPSKMLLRDFEGEDILDDLENFMHAIRPLYEQFHAHIRFLLREKYGQDYIKKYYPYPLDIAEVLIGKSYGEEKDVAFPFADKFILNITEILLEKNFQTVDLFKTTEDFFSSIGLKKYGDDFWHNNAYPFEGPEETCTNQAWDLRGDSFRKLALTYCSNVSYSGLSDFFESVTNLRYMESYSNLSFAFREEPLPQFSSAINEAIMLSIGSPKSLRKLGIANDENFGDQIEFNQLYLEAMQQVFTLPIFFVLDKYRVQLLDKEISKWDNCAYWDLNVKFTGGMPPVKRSHDDFDAPSKLILGVDNPYSSFIVQSIIRHQLYKHFCIKSGQYRPEDPQYLLHRCDLAGNLDFGQRVEEAMKLGSTKTWRQVLEILTGTDQLDFSGFLEYFEPVRGWLEQTNKKNDAEIGWENISNCD